MTPSTRSFSVSPNGREVDSTVSFTPTPPCRKEHNVYVCVGGGG
jgi:hypothetical protein